MSQVYIIGVGMIRFTKYPEKSIKQMTLEALQSLFADLPVKKEEIEAVWFSNSSIKAGLYDLVLAVGAEKVYFPEDRQKMFEGFLSGTDVEVTRKLIEMMKAQARKKAKEIAKKTGKPVQEKQRTAFMDIYALGARRHMEKYRTTQKQLAVIASKNHFHGSLNPMAQYQKNMSVEEVLNDLLVAYPLTRSMCAPIGDGSAVVLLCSERYKKKLGSKVKPVRVEASVVLSGRLKGEDEPSVVARLAKKAYEMAGWEEEFPSIPAEGWNVGDIQLVPPDWLKLLSWCFSSEEVPGKGR